MQTTFTAVETVWPTAPIPAAVEAAVETVASIYHHLDETAAALVERVPEFQAAMRAFFIDLRTRIYGERKE